MTCHLCGADMGVVWIAKQLYCGRCYLAWTRLLVSVKREDSSLDCQRKMKRVERQRSEAA